MQTKIKTTTKKEKKKKKERGRTWSGKSLNVKKITRITPPKFIQGKEKNISKNNHQQKCIKKEKRKRRWPKNIYTQAPTRKV
jgi:hypothetical protein